MCAGKIVIRRIVDDVNARQYVGKHYLKLLKLFYLDGCSNSIDEIGMFDGKIYSKLKAIKKWKLLILDGKFYEDECFKFYKSLDIKHYIKI